MQQLKENKALLFLFIITILLISGCGSKEDPLNETNDIHNELSDYENQEENINENHYLVQAVKNSYPTDQPDKLYGDAFNDFFGSPAWTYVDDETGEQIVEFTGYMIYSGTRVKAKVQFSVQDHDVELKNLLFNELPQNDFTKDEVLSLIFSSDKQLAAHDQLEQSIKSSKKEQQSKPDLSTGQQLQIIPSTEKPSKDITDKQTPNPSSPNKKTDPFPPSLYEGKIEGIPVVLGDDIKTMTEVMGNPLYGDMYGGSYYYAYDKFTFFSDTYIEGEGIVSAISVHSAFSFLGIQIGQTFSEIQDVLGSGSIEFGELDQLWQLDYQVGKHRLFFQAEDIDGPTLSGQFYY